MKFNTSYIIAGSLLVLGAVWFFVNNLGEETPLTVSTPATVKVEARKSIPTVQVRRIAAQEHPNVLELYGQTRAAREVSVKAETPGLVAAIGAVEGARVKKGQTLCRQDMNARQALVDQAKANLRSVETDLNAARVLADKGYQSQTRVTAFEAQLDGARAALKQAEIEADNVNIRAPFNGVWEQQDAEVGDYLSPGMSCGLLVDLSPLEVDVELTEGQLGLVERGTSAEIALATGETVTGEVAFIEAKADPSTRTFRAELHVPNADYELRAGVTATVRLTSGLTLASKVPTNVLSLDDAGNVGLRYVDAADIVRFTPTRTIDEEADGAWVTGLPDGARLITTGQDFVAVGQQVIADETYDDGRTQNVARSGGNPSSQSAGN
ncbi:efflux RND transporter periplasmic adaptor subunit [Litorimonas sp. WD9-15]|uniref:efflux RND transporter periplasmic adaptor subunit n=1 Tax=Litorimonas sp. WD9-15 TaxID=3418716 RepID=UPI003D0839AA